MTIFYLVIPPYIYIVKFYHYKQVNLIFTYASTETAEAAGKLESASICRVIVANSASANPSIVKDPLDPLAFGAKKIVVVLSKLA